MPAPLAPLPPLLAALHARLEAHAEATEEGVLIVEQDRRPPPGGAPQLPVIVFIPAAPRPGALAGRVAPELIAEVVGPLTTDERRARFARAGVLEYWRVDAGQGEGPTVAVHRGPRPDGTWAEVTVFRAADVVRSGLFPGLALRPGDLVGP